MLRGTLRVACFFTSVPLSLGLSGFAQAADWGGYDVGHTTMSVAGHKGSVNEDRPLDVLIWYPADPNSYKNAPPSTYKSRLKGVPLPGPWTPLSWEFAAERARDNPTIKTRGRSYPLIVVSHPNLGDPFNSSKINERLASYGYIVAAPFHNGDTQDDVRIDFINTLPERTGYLSCLDGLAGPCTDGLRKSMQDRALDISAVITSIPFVFGEHVDMGRIGFVGLSRGSASGLGVGGGSTELSKLGIAADARVAALFLLTAGGQANPLMNHAAITLPTVQVTGTEDRNMGPSRTSFLAINSPSKAYVEITGAWHRGLSADSYCEQMQAIGPIAQDSAAILDLHSLRNLLLSPNLSGTALDHCPYEAFVEPADLRDVVFAQTGVRVTPENVPTSIDIARVSVMRSGLARAFFGDVLEVRGDDSFSEYLVGEFQEKYGENLTAVELQGFR